MMDKSIVMRKKKRFFKNYSAMEIRKFPFVYLIIALPVLQFAIFWFYVNFSAIALSFQDGAGNWSLDSIKRVINAFAAKRDSLGLNPLEMLGKSVIIWVVSHVVMFTISIFTSYMLTKYMPASKLFRLIYSLPGLVGSVVFAIIMKEMFAYNGIVTDFLKKIGVDLPEAALRNGLLGAKETAFATIIIKSFIFGITGSSMIIASAYMKIPNEIFESAKLEGCGFFREMAQIAIPCIWPTLSTLIVFSLCSIFTADAGMYLYSNGSGANGMVSVGFYLYRYQVTISQVQDATYMYGYVSAFGMLITIITLPIVLIGRKLLSMVHEDVGF